MVLPRSQLDVEGAAAEPLLAIVRDEGAARATDAEFNALVAKLHKAQHELEADREELEAERERFERRRQRLEERERRLEADQERLAAAQAATTSPRLPPAARPPEPANLKCECERLRREQAEWREEQGLWRQAQTLWLAEREETARKLAATESKLSQAKAALAARGESGEAPDGPFEADTRRADDLQKRFELAVQDVRELKRRNGDLEDKLAEFKANRSTAKSGDDGLDWESQKRRLLAALEEGDIGRSADNRLTLEGAIHITDEVVAQRDRELADLRSQLAELKDQAPRSPETAERSEAVDQDAAVQAERAKLLELQEAWREKLKQAEIDLSIERAKMARERADIEEKLQTYSAEKQRRANDGGDSLPDTPQKPARGRWLARLGLKDGDA